jgi:hypothetical protein
MSALIGIDRRQTPAPPHEEGNGDCCQHHCGQ